MKHAPRPSGLLSDDEAGLPHWGYVYLLLNAADSTGGHASHVAFKIGASHALERRQKSFPNPIDLDASQVVRFANWDAAYAFEQFLHTQPKIAAARWPEFLVLNDYWREKREREGEAGRYEWFRIQALAEVQAALANPRLKKLFGWSEVLPAADVMLYKERPDLAARRQGLRVAAQILPELFAFGACRVAAVENSPTLDRYGVALLVPDTAVQRGILAEAGQLDLPYLDGRGVGLIGQVTAIGSELLVTLPFMQPNRVEQGREAPHIGLVREIMQAPAAGKLPAPVVAAMREVAAMPKAAVNGALPVNMPSKRRIAPPVRPLNLFGDDGLPSADDMLPK